MKPDLEQLAMDKLLCRTRVEVCSKNQISESTFYRLQREPEFAAILRETKNKLFSEARSVAQASCLEAVVVLRQIASDESAPPSARVSAAGRLIDMGQTSFEAEEIIDRLDQLERRIFNEKKTD
jgi:hypothetical protein